MLAMPWGIAPARLVYMPTCGKKLVCARVVCSSIVMPSLKVRVVPVIVLSVIFWLLSSLTKAGVTVRVINLVFMIQPTVVSKQWITPPYLPL
jgi:hypothetical protein